VVPSSTKTSYNCPAKALFTIIILAILTVLKIVDVVAALGRFQLDFGCAGG
jgi:hypothetical protein